MKKIICSLCSIICLAVSFPTYAAGGITHMYIANQTIPLLTNKKLHDILLDHMDEYLTGSNYPDTGYVDGAHYGEDSHWDPFLDAFVAEIKQKYPDAVQQNPALIAFLMGCATHRISDEIFHGKFVTEEAREDFAGDWNTAHTYSDTGLDFLINMEKSQWLARPSTWWVPVDDLVQVYQIMGKNYSADEIRHGNSVYKIAGIGERIADPIVYLYYKYKMPWGDNNYENTEQGGMRVMEVAAAAKLDVLWLKLTSNNLK